MDFDRQTSRRLGGVEGRQTPPQSGSRAKSFSLLSKREAHDLPDLRGAVIPLASGCVAMFSQDTSGNISQNMRRLLAENKILNIKI